MLLPMTLPSATQRVVDTARTTRQHIDELLGGKSGRSAGRDQRQQCDAIEKRFVRPPGDFVLSAAMLETGDQASL